MGFRIGEPALSDQVFRISRKNTQEDSCFKKKLIKGFTSSCTEKGIIINNVSKQKLIFGNEAIRGRDAASFQSLATTTKACPTANKLKKN